MSRTVARVSVWSVVLAALAVLPFLVLPGPAATAAKDAATPSHAALVARGRELVTLGGCNDCHTPWKMDEALGMPMPDMTRMLSGHAPGAPDPAGQYATPDVGVIGPDFTSFRMPFGVVYSANLTPDKATGLGAWTEEQFIRAIRTGKYMGGNGRAILAPMPWPGLAQLSDDDLKAIFAYLQSIPAIRNPVPPPKVPDPAIEKITASSAKLAATIRQQREAAAKKK